MVTSTELPHRPSQQQIDAMGQPGKKVLGSTSFVPSVAGIMVASYVVQQLIHSR